MTQELTPKIELHRVGWPPSHRPVSRSSISRWQITLATLFVICCGVTAPSWSQEARTWTDASGKFSVEATIKELKRDSVVLILTDGTERTVALDQLSEADRRYAADYRKTMLAENAAKKKAAAESKQRGEDLKDELQSILDSFNQREEQLKQSGTDAAQIRNARQPLVQETSQQLLKLVEAVPQSEVARDVYIWVVRNGAQGTEAATAIEALVQHFADSPEILPFIGLIARDFAMLEKLQSKAKDKAVKGVATFMLARQLSSADNPALEDRVLKLLNEVISKYADVADSARRPLGPQAERLLFAVENLSIGKVAPDIIGSDLDGVAFKLSDYRGKVVVLDFWGDW